MLASLACLHLVVAAEAPRATQVRGGVCDLRRAGPAVAPAELPCGHAYCQACTVEPSIQEAAPPCPPCRAWAGAGYLKNRVVHRARRTNVTRTRSSLVCASKSRPHPRVGCDVYQRWYEYDHHDTSKSMPGRPRAENLSYHGIPSGLYHPFQLETGTIDVPPSTSERPWAYWANIFRTYAPTHLRPGRGGSS